MSEFDNSHIIENVTISNTNLHAAFIDFIKHNIFDVLAQSLHGVVVHAVRGWNMGPWV